MAQPEDDMTLSQVFQSDDPAMLDEFASLQQAQQQSMAQHEAYRQRLGQAEEQTVQRQGDLAMTQRFYQLLDPNTPKAARSHLYSETARTLGLDPKATSTAEIGKVLTSLDPQSAAAVRSMISQGLNSAAPGDARKMYTALLKGDIPMSEIISRTQQAAAADQARTAAEVEQMGQQQRPPGMMRLGGPLPNPNEEPLATPAQDPGTEPFVPQNTVRSGTGDLSAQQVEPDAFGVIGGELDPRRNGGRTTYSDEEIRAKWPAFPRDKNAQVKGLTELRNNRVGATNMTRNVRELWDLGTNEEFLGLTGSATRGIDSIRSIWEGLKGVYGETVLGGLAENMRDPDGSVVRAQVRMADQAAATYLNINGIKGNARQASEVRTLMLSMAYEYARAADPNGRISDADVRNALRMISDSSSVEQLQGSLSRISNDVYNRYSTHASSFTGAPVGMSLSHIEDAELLKIWSHPSTPEVFKRNSVGPEIVLRRDMERQRGQQPGAQPPQQTPQGPGPGVVDPMNPAGPGQAPAAPAAPAQQPTAPAPTGPPAAPATSPNEASSIRERQRATFREGLRQRQRVEGREDRAESRAEEGLAITRANQERQAGQFREVQDRQASQFRETQDRAASQFERAQARAVEQFERQFKRQGEWRDEDKVQKAKDKFQAAWQAFAKAIGASAPRMSAGGGRRGGGDQDPRAFVVPGKPQRRPPNIPQVRKSK